MYPKKHCKGALGMFSKANSLCIVSILELEPVISERPYYWTLFLSRVCFSPRFGTSVKVCICGHVCIGVHVCVGQGLILDYLTLPLSILVFEGLSLNLEFPVSFTLSGQYAPRICLPQLPLSLFAIPSVLHESWGSKLRSSCL